LDLFTVWARIATPAHKAASQDLGKHLRAPQRGSTPACRYPSRSLTRGWPSSRFMRAPLARTAMALISRDELRLSRHDAFQHPDHRDEECPSAHPGDDDRERPFARIDGPSYFSRNDAFQAAWHRDEVFRRRAPYQSRSLRRGTSVDERRIENLRAKRRTLWPPRYTGPPPAVATADEGTAASAARQRRTSFQLRCAPPGRDRCEDLTPGDASSRPSGGTNAVGLELRPLRRRSVGGGLSQRPVPISTSDVTIACLKEPQHDHIQVATAGEQRRIGLGTTSWNHAFEERPLPATRSHLCAPEQRSETSRSRARGAGRRWLTSPRSRKSLGLAAPVWTSNLYSERQALGLPNDWS
jgi:hypothetical protein